MEIAIPIEWPQTMMSESNSHLHTIIADISETGSGVSPRISSPWWSLRLELFNNPKGQITLLSKGRLCFLGHRRSDVLPLDSTACSWASTGSIMWTETDVQPNTGDSHWGIIQRHSLAEHPAYSLNKLVTARKAGSGARKTNGPRFLCFLATSENLHPPYSQ